MSACDCAPMDTRDEQRASHLRRAGLAFRGDPAYVTTALLALWDMGCRDEDMRAAGEVLRARPPFGEWLVVHDGKATRWYHKCLQDGESFTAARIVWLPKDES